MRGNIETPIQENVTVFRNEYNNLIHTISSKNIYAELHNCFDTKNDYVDIEINTTFDKDSLEFLINTLKEYYIQMEK